MWDVRSVYGRAGQGVVSQGLGSAPALSMPLNTLSSLTSLQLSSSGIQRVRRQRGVLQKQGSTGKSLGTPYPPGPGSALSEPLPSCAVAAVSRVQEPCVTPKAPEQSRGNKHLPTQPYALAPPPEPSPADFPAMPALGVCLLGSWAVQSPVLSVC